MCTLYRFLINVVSLGIILDPSHVWTIGFFSGVDWQSRDGKVPHGEKHFLRRSKISAGLKTES